MGNSHFSNGFLTAIQLVKAAAQRLLLTVKSETVKLCKKLLSYEAPIIKSVKFKKFLQKYYILYILFNGYNSDKPNVHNIFVIGDVARLWMTSPRSTTIQKVRYL